MVDGRLEASMLLRTRTREVPDDLAASCPSDSLLHTMTMTPVDVEQDRRT